MLISAIFIGSNSLGYVYGQTYQLNLISNSIRRLDGTGYCPYSSIHSFLKNWTIVAKADSEENLKLITASPDLLAACKQLIYASHQEHFEARLNDEEMKGINMMKAAIEKAAHNPK